MNFFDQVTQITKVVPIDDENSVTVRSLAHGEENAIQRNCVRTTITTASPNGEVQVDYVRFKDDVMIARIVSWEGPGFDGREVSKENIDALPQFIIEKIIYGLNEMDAPDPNLNGASMPPTDD